jgi:hypothetical protein
MVINNDFTGGFCSRINLWWEEREMIHLKRKKSDKNRGVKLKREFEKGGEAGFIRDLAHALETEDAGLNSPDELSDLVRNYGKISIDIKRKDDRVFCQGQG